MSPLPELVWALLVLQLVQLGLVIALAAAVRRLRDQAAPAPAPLAELAAQLEPPLRRLFEQLEAEVARARTAADATSAALDRLTRLEHVAEAASDAAPAGDARAEARRLLKSGRTAADVAAATGLPDGEVQLLANLIGATGGAPATES